MVLSPKLSLERGFLRFDERLWAGSTAKLDNRRLPAARPRFMDG